MPAKLEKALYARAAQRGLKGAKLRRFVYGTMRKQGWKPKKERQ